MLPSARQARTHVLAISFPKGKTELNRSTHTRKMKSGSISTSAQPVLTQTWQGKKWASEQWRHRYKKKKSAVFYVVGPKIYLLTQTQIYISVLRQTETISTGFLWSKPLEDKMHTWWRENLSMPSAVPMKGIIVIANIHAVVTFSPFMKLLKNSNKHPCSRFVHAGCL